MIKLGLTEEEISITKNSFKAYLNIGNSYKYIKYIENMRIIKMDFENPSFCVIISWIQVIL